jgi:hypothetical protein
MTALVLAQTVILIVLAVLVFGLLRAYGTVLQRLHAIEHGTAQRRPGVHAAPHRATEREPYRDDSAGGGVSVGA